MEYASENSSRDDLWTLVSSEINDGERILSRRVKRNKSDGIFSFICSRVGSYSNQSWDNSKHAFRLFARQIEKMRRSHS